MSRANPRYRRANPNLPFIPNGSSVILYRMVGSIEGQQTINTFTYLGPVGTPNQTQLSTLLAAANTALALPLRNVISADWTIVATKIDVVSLNTIIGVTTTGLAGLAGTRGAGHEPTQMSITVARASGVKGQHGRGRLQLPAPASADVTASTITSGTLITALGSLEVAMLLPLSDGANTWNPCIAQRSVASPHLVIGAAALVSATHRLVLGTTRRRKLGVGA